MHIQFVDGIPSSAEIAMELPAPGTIYNPRCLQAVPRTFQDRFQVIGVCHNTCNEDLEAVYYSAHLAARSAICTRNQEQLTFVEVGTWCGESALMTGTAMMDVAQQFYRSQQPLEAALVVVDTFGGTLTDLNGATLRGWGGDLQGVCADNLVQLEFQTAVPQITFLVDIVQADSLEVADSEVYSDLDFVFIDAGHTYEECRQDILHWWPRLRPGGYMCGHDYDTIFHQVVLAVDKTLQELAGAAPLLFEGTSVWLVKKSNNSVISQL